MLLTGRGIIFIVLNVIRILSLIALFLVFVSNILVLAGDIKSYNSHLKTGNDDPEMQALLKECGYIE
jgi:hypothetical protein